MTKLQKITMAILASLMVVNFSLLFFGREIQLLIINAKAGCYPWSPAVVFYEPGMTLCPGQTGRILIPFKIEKVDHGDRI